jgi:hypothetical protein
MVGRRSSRIQWIGYARKKKMEAELERYAVESSVVVFLNVVFLNREKPDEAAQRSG